MSGRIPQSFVDDLLARTDIVGVIEARVPLKRAGRNYSACCPFHKEKTPSFSVSQDKQFYYCFGCGATGNAIGFLMEYERRAFPEAVQELADRAGLAVPHEDDDGRGDEQRARNRALYDALTDADKFFQQQLRKHAQRARAVDYLKGRGLTGEIAQRFGMGYAPPGWDNLLATLGGDVKRQKLYADNGLVIEQDGKTYDRFRDRIMFPIRDVRGRVIGFGGRIIGDGKPKYLNSPETPVFHKGRELYGLHEAKLANKTLDRLLVVEGYMDVIALAQQGITCAVATLGTACTGDHVDLLFRHTGEVVFCFDGDAAGRRAAWRALEATLPKLLDGRSARVLFLPQEHDPDSLVRVEGADAFNARLMQADSLDDVLLRELASRVDLSRTDGRARLATLAKPYVMQIPGEILRALVTEKLAAMAQIDARLLAQTPAGPVEHIPFDGEERDIPAPDDSLQTPPPWAHSRRDASRNANRNARAPMASLPSRLVHLLAQTPELAADFHLPPEVRALDIPHIDLLLDVLDILQASEHPSLASLFGMLRAGERYDEFAALIGREFLLGDAAPGAPAPSPDALRQELKDGARQLTLAFWDAEIARELRQPGGPDTDRLRGLYAQIAALKGPAPG